MSPPKTRTRSTTENFGKGTVSTTERYIAGPSKGLVVKSSSSASWGSLKGTQTTVSEGHPFKSRRTGDPGDVGGEFYTTRQYVLRKPGRTQLHVEWNNPPYSVVTDVYDGPTAPVDPSTLTYPPTLESTTSALNKSGATAIARCKPTNSVADASVFLGELLKDGLPALAGHRTWKARTRRAQEAAGEYLNVQFGWRPLVNDVRNFSYAVTHAHNVLSQYERDNGKVVRRTYRFPVQRSTTDTVWKTNARMVLQPDASSFYAGTPAGTVIRTRETVRNQWFSGAFTYHMPTGSDARSAMGRHALEAKKLLGISLTPDTLWNLAPWSWTVDWFSNTGDVISNISDWATDGLVMRYGYMMEHTIVKDSYRLVFSSGVAPTKSDAPLVLVTETKIRKRANPFGFGLTWNGLSTVQLAILGALGISRSL